MNFSKEKLKLRIFKKSQIPVNPVWHTRKILSFSSPSRSYSVSTSTSHTTYRKDLSKESGYNLGLLLTQSNASFKSDSHKSSGERKSSSRILHREEEALFVLSPLATPLIILSVGIPGNTFLPHWKHLSEQLTILSNQWTPVPWVPEVTAFMLTFIVTKKKGLLLNITTYNYPVTMVERTDNYLYLVLFYSYLRLGLFSLLVYCFHFLVHVCTCFFQFPPVLFLRE